MRADFYSDLMRSTIWEELRMQRHEITPLRGAALREAIVRPAEKVGVHIEVDLVERLVREADADRAAEALPLLQVALEQLWRKRKWRYLSIQDYEELSEGNLRGLDVALARHADAALDEISSHAKLARRVLIDLVQLGEGRPHTRRRRKASDLIRSGDDVEAFNLVLSHLVKTRLITMSAPLSGSLPTSMPDERYADLGHDALIVGWPKLSTWIDERVDDLHLQRRLETRVQSGRLLDNEELVEFERWRVRATMVEMGISKDLDRLTILSKRAQRKRRLAWLIGMTLILLLLCGLAFLAWRLIAALHHFDEQQEEIRSACMVQKDLPICKNVR